MTWMRKSGASVLPKQRYTELSSIKDPRPSRQYTAGSRNIRAWDLGLRWIRPPEAGIWEGRDLRDLGLGK